MAERLLLVSYDISNDRRRTKLHNLLLNYGTPVQYSVFECLLDAADEARMRREVKRVIRERTDHVRFYVFCATCAAKIETTGGHDLLGKPPSALIVG